MVSRLAVYLRIYDSDSVNTGLNSRLHLEDFYSKYCGMVTSSSNTNCFSGFPNVSALPDNIDDTRIIDNTEALTDFLIYDRKIHSEERERYWTLMLSYKDVICAVSKRQGCVQGIGCIQPVVTGYRIAPLYADSAAIANVVFKKLCDATNFNNKPSQVTIDSVNPNEEAKTIFERCGLKLTSTSLLRMYSKKEIPLKWNNVFALSNTDLSVV